MFWSVRITSFALIDLHQYYKRHYFFVGTIIFAEAKYFFEVSSQ